MFLINKRFYFKCVVQGEIFVVFVAVWCLVKANENGIKLIPEHEGLAFQVLVKMNLELDFNTQGYFFIFSSQLQCFFCRGLSRNGEQGPARSDPPAPRSAAHQLLLPAGRQHVPRRPAAGAVRPQRGADHAHEPLDSGLPAHARTEIHDHGSRSRPGGPSDSFPGFTLHSRAALPSQTSQRCARRPVAAQGQTEVWLC